ncbi:hypothetical protein K474DRAFT_1655941 [Panus rudis PR-1116 ss-1]|nr:hypothetical protein K474DRAFT_1655941 [Panus rudis PR-1116 ss-1]
MAQNISLSSLLRNSALQSTLASPSSAQSSASSSNVFRYPPPLHPYPSPTLSDSQLPISLQSSSWQTQTTIAVDRPLHSRPEIPHRSMRTRSRPTLPASS